MIKYFCLRVDQQLFHAKEHCQSQLHPLPSPALRNETSVHPQAPDVENWTGRSHQAICIKWCTEMIKPKKTIAAKKKKKIII